MEEYKYRLTVVWKSGRIWKLGVQSPKGIKEAMKELSPSFKKIGSLSSVCLSFERTGKIIWHKTAEELGV